MGSTNHLPECVNQTAIVTGANSGLGFETSLQLAKLGARVIMGCRDTAKGEIAKLTILDKYPEAQLVVEFLDLADLASIHCFTQKINFSDLSLLINNAGVMNLPYLKTKDGFEMQMATNHLGHFALTGLLLPMFAPNARIVTVSSLWHRFGKIHWDDFFLEKNYNPRQAYCNSKLANLLFTFELARRLKESKSTVISVATHPGYSATNLQFVAPEMEGKVFKYWTYYIGNKFIAQSPAQGALPTIYAACANNIHNGDYIGPDGFLEIRGFPKKVKAIKLAYDEHLGQKLWDLSEKLTDVYFKFPSTPKSKMEKVSSRNP